MIEVLHDFYKNDICPDFKFIPTTQTGMLLANCNAICKTVGNKLIVLVKTDDAGKPFIKPASTDRFSFFLELSRPLFMTVSNLGLPDLSKQRFYFTNLHQNKETVSSNDILYLSAPIAGYDGAKTYQPGEFVKHGAVIYECIKTSTGNNPPAAEFWLSRQQNEYASPADFVKLITDQQEFHISAPVTDVTIFVYKLNPANNQFDEIALAQTQHFSSPVSSVQVNLSSLPDAKYRVVVNADEQWVYLSNEAVYNNLFGVIDLYNHLPDGNDFAFFDASGKVKDQVIASKNLWLTYSIRFANRTAFWKYFVAKKGVQAIESNADYSFTGNAHPADFFTSNKPIPIVEQPHEFKITLFQPVSSDPPLAPNPDVNASGMLTRSGADYYCNIYLNY